MQKRERATMRNSRTGKEFPVTVHHSDASLLEKAKRFIASPDDWPHYPLLPLKRIGSNFTQRNAMGFIFPHPLGSAVTVYLGLIFSVPQTAAKICGKTGAENATWTEIQAHYQSETFASVDEMLKVFEVD